MNASVVEQVLGQYAEVYRKVYHRTPRDMRILDHEWLIVNGSRMRVQELMYLTDQLQLEYTQTLEKRRTVVNRLIGWFKKT